MATWRTSCTPPAPPETRRRSRSATTTSPWFPSASRTFSGGGWLHASPPYTFAGLSFVYTPMKLGMRGIYHTAVRRRSLARNGRDRAPDRRLPRAGDGTSSSSTTPTSTLPISPRCRSARSAALRSPPSCSSGCRSGCPTATVSNNYGMTEAGSVYCIMPPGEAVKRPGSVGKPVPPAEVRCVDADGAERGAPGRWASVRLRMPGPAPRVLRRSGGHRPHLGRRMAGDRRPRAGSTRTATSTSSGGART